MYVGSNALWNIWRQHYSKMQQLNIATIIWQSILNYIPRHSLCCEKSILDSFGWAFCLTHTRIHMIDVVVNIIDRWIDINDIRNEKKWIEICGNGAGPVARPPCSRVSGPPSPSLPSAEGRKPKSGAPPPRAQSTPVLQDIWPKTWASLRIGLPKIFLVQCS